MNISNLAKSLIIAISSLFAKEGVAQQTSSGEANGDYTENTEQPKKSTNESHESQITALPPEFANIQGNKDEKNKKVAGGDDPPIPEIESAGILTEDLPGIERSKDGKNTLIIKYSFSKTPNVDEYIHNKSDRYKDYRSFNNAERKALMKVIKEFENVANVKFEQVAGDETPYVTFACFDMSNYKIEYDGRTVTAAGSCGYPSRHGVVVAIGSHLMRRGWNVFVSTLTHEIGHLFGMKHPHESPNYPKSYYSTPITTMSYEEVPDAGSACVTYYTPKLYTEHNEFADIGVADALYMQQYYGPSPYREPRKYVVGQKRYVQAIHLIKGDSLDIEAGGGLIDLNPFHVSETTKPYGVLVINKSPDYVNVSGDNNIVLSGDSNDIELSGTSNAIVVENKGANIHLGIGDDKIILPKDSFIVALSNFDVEKDVIFMRENVGSYEIKEARNMGCGYILFYDKEKNPIGVIIADGITSEMLKKAELTQITEKTLREIIHTRKSVMQLEEGDNGELHGYDFNKHHLQYNPYPPTGQALQAHFINRLDGSGKVDVYIRTDFQEDVLQFTLPEQCNPAVVDLYYNGNQIPIAEGRYTDNEGTEISYSLDYKFIDCRRTQSKKIYVTLRNDNVLIVGDTATSVYTTENISAHIEVAGTAPVKLDLLNAASRITINKFDTSKDEIVLGVGDFNKAEYIKFENGEIGIIMYNSKEEPKPENALFINIGQLTGKVEDISITKRPAGKIKLEEFNKTKQNKALCDESEIQNFLIEFLKQQTNFAINSTDNYVKAKAMGNNNSWLIRANQQEQQEGRQR